MKLQLLTPRCTSSKYPVPPQAGPILGVEFSGVVVEVNGESKEVAGENISAARWTVGDEVFGLTYGGAYAQFVAVSGAMLVRKPAHLSWVECAGIPENFLTAYQALVLVGEYQKGESVLVHAGASGVGVAANQIARSFGAKHVLTTAGTDDKVRFLERLEVAPTKGINYRTQDFADVVKKETDGKGVDVVRPLSSLLLPVLRLLTFSRVPTKGDRFRRRRLLLTQS